MKIRPVEDELFHEEAQTDKRTDITKLIVGFRNFANAPETRNSRVFFFLTTFLEYVA